VPVIVALHFIRTRRRKQTVSALFLWQQAREAAQRKRRFSASWLLLLQVLFATLAALALARPSLITDAAPDRVFIIDASASMTARDSDGVRLDKALEGVEALLRESGRAALLRAGLDATVAVGLSDDHGSILRAAQELRAVDASSDLQRALDLAETIAPGAIVHVFSDSPLPSGASASLHSVAGDGQNIGITAFELRGREAFISVAGNNPRPESVRLRLERGETLVAETELLVSAGNPADALLATGGAPGFYRAVLDVPEWDALSLDDVAYAGSRSLRVLQVTPSEAVERALSAIPGVESLRVVAAMPVSTAVYDVVVLVGNVPETLPPGRYLIFAPPRAEPSYRSIIDWDRAHPLLRFVDLSGVVVASGEGTPPLAEADWRPLAQTDTLSAAIQRLVMPEVEAVYLDFHPTQTDLVNRTAFPIFLYNVFQEFRGEDRLTLGGPLPPAERIFVNGQETRAERVLVPGLYNLDGRLYSASLLSPEQSRLPAAPAAVAEVPPRAETGTVRALDWAIWFLLLALVLLLAEWLLWSRGATPWASRA
jgi:Ca-activated chloride channel homolog